MGVTLHGVGGRLISGRRAEPRNSASHFGGSLPPGVGGSALVPVATLSLGENTGPIPYFTLGTWYSSGVREATVCNCGFNSRRVPYVRRDTASTLISAGSPCGQAQRVQQSGEGATLRWL